MEDLVQASSVVLPSVMSDSSRSRVVLCCVVLSVGAEPRRAEQWDQTQYYRLLPLPAPLRLAPPIPSLSRP
ncbi:hypothetical protein E2C01_068665 [Portunus trituberculatus]|uniref:Uncharacterized protein n=1 Tax=Portunus trituberculatus TaxID=210409 RepID=A0A5B7I032_PORTR|nr:hypothetical protein [Portunus trituberculatus]